VKKLLTILAATAISLAFLAPATPGVAGPVHADIRAHLISSVSATTRKGAWQCSNCSAEWTPCKSAQTLAYPVLVKDPASLKGTCVSYEAQVFQFDSNTGPTQMLVAITNEGLGIWDNVVEVELAKASVGADVYENDIIRFVGRIAGFDDYTTSLGGTNTVPAVDATQIELVGAKTKTTTSKTTTTRPPTTTTTVRPVPAGATHVVGTFADDDGGQNTSGGWILWSNGRVQALLGAPNYGSATASGLNNFVGMVDDIQSNGYWLVTSTGRIFPFGTVCQDQTLTGPKTLPAPAVGAVNLKTQITEGFALVTATGATYAYECSF
jgi:hypothetical protein